MTPEMQKVVEQLSACSRELDHLSVVVADLDYAAVVADAAHEVAHSRAFLSAEGPIEERKQKAVLECAELKLEKEVAAQKVRACNARIRALRDRLEVGRSLNAAVRSQFAAEAVGQ